MFPTFISILDIQSWWEVPCVAHFCSLFSQIFNLPDFHIEDLEEALLADGNEGQTTLLSDLIVSLLRGCDLLHNCRQHIHSSNYQMFLRRLFRKECRIHNIENPFDSDTDFQLLPLKRKLEILHNLCYFRLESSNVSALLDKLEADSLRIEPLGYDDKNSAYWYFFGTRLYREDYLKGERKSKVKCDAVWQVICFTEDDWTNLAAKLKASTSRRNRALSKILYENFLPKIPKLFKEKEDQRRRNFIKKASRARVLSLKKNSDESERELTDSEVNKLVGSVDGSSDSNVEDREEGDHWDIRKRSHRHGTRGSPSSNYSTLASGSSSPVTHLSENVFNYSTEDCGQQCSVVPNVCAGGSETDSCKSSLAISQDSCEKSAVPMNRKQKEVKKTVSSAKMSPATNKLPGRQTNNSLSSITGNIIIPEMSSGNAKSTSVGGGSGGGGGGGGGGGNTTEKVSSSTTSNTEKVRKKKAKASQIFTASIIPTLSFTETEEVLQIGMHKVLEYVKNHKDAWPFMDPVEEDIAPRYYSIIRRPMDLLKMEEKLDNGEYATFTEFRNDFKLIVNNCRLYNGQNNEYTEMVNNLQEAFEKGTKKYFEQNSSDEEDANLEYPDLKTNVFREKYAGPAKPVTPTKSNKKEVIAKKSTTKRSKHSVDEQSEESDVSEEVIKVKKGRVSEGGGGGAKESAEKQKTKHRHQELIAVKEPIESPRGMKRKRKEKDKDRKRRKKNDGKSETKNQESDVEESEVEEEKKVTSRRGKETPKASPTKKEKPTKAAADKSSVSSVKRDKKSAKEVAKKVESPKNAGKSGQKKTKSAPKEVSVKSEKSSKSKKVSEPAVVTVSKDISSEAIIADHPVKKKTTEKKETKKGKEKSTKSKDKPPVKAKEEESPRRNKHKAKAEAPPEKKAKATSNLSPISSERSSVLSQSASKIDNSKVNSKTSTSRFHRDDDLMSISSRSFSRSPSPVSSTFSNDSDDFHSKRKLPSRPPTPDIRDKFDLIKERRRRLLGEEKSGSKSDHSGSGKGKSSSSKNSSKGSPSTKDGGLLTKDTKDKHQTLNETIEKLKLSNEKTKQRTAVIDEILGVKPAREQRDEKTIFERLKDPNADAKPTAPKHTQGRDKKKDEYDFVDDTVAPTVSSHRTKKENQAKSGKKNSKSSKVLTDTPSKKNSKANMEALEQGVWEQTLKDINRWLEPPSDSNSPSRYIWDDFEAEDFRRPVPIQQSAARTAPPSDVPLVATPQKEQQAASAGPPRPNQAPGQNPAVGQPRKDGARDKRKTLKDKITVRKRDVARPIDRLQPGKTKGNLIQNTNKPDELFPLGNLSKLKEIKNSLMVKQTESGPKLSLGTVLDTQEFGLVQQHNFVDEVKDGAQEKVCEKENTGEEKEKVEAFVRKDVEKVKDERTVKEAEVENQKEKPTEKVSATPNLSAWIKAFGAPKKSKKTEEDDATKKKVDTSPTDVQTGEVAGPGSVPKSPISAINGAESGSTTYSNQPAPRQRKASTGSTVSERSSYSQDPDSPRIAIDERMYPGPYPSPLGASPILTSPKPEELPKSASPYSLNGAIKVGFYQDTTTKSSPEKSCSPREQPSTYPQYSQHVYSSAASPAMTGLTSPSYGSYGSYHTTTVTAADAKKGGGGSSKSPASYYDQYKQRPEESADYTNSMSPNNNPNSPYQHQQMSPYQQQHSPYQQQQHSPYQQQPQQKVNSGPISPYQTATPQQQTALSPSQQHPQQPQYHARQQQQQVQQQQVQKSMQGPPVSPFSQSNHSSPYSQHDPNSPYPQAQPEQLSPFQNPNSPKQTPAQVPPEGSQIATTNAGEWQPPTHIPPQFEGHPMMPPAAHGQQPLPAQCGQEKQPVQLQHPHRSHLQAPMAHHQEMAQNMTPAHQNYPPYTTLQGKRYEEPQNPFMTQQALRQQNVYDPAVAEASNLQNPLNYRQNAPSSAQNQPMQPTTEDTDKNHPNDPMARLAADKQQQQQMFDLLAFSKYGKQLDISTSKAFEMFNRAASMGFPKTLPLASSGSTVPPSGSSKTPPDLFDLNYGKGITQADYPGQGGNNPRVVPQQKIITELGAMTGYQQQLKQHHGVENKSIPGAHQAPNPQLQQSTQQHIQGAAAKGVDLAIPNPRQTPLLHDTEAPGQKNPNAPRYETLQPPGAYKAPHPYNPSASSALIDPSLRNLTPLPIMDEHLLSLQQSTAGGYYDKTIPSAHMFGKNMHQQMFTSAPISTMSPYNTAREASGGNNYQLRIPPEAAVHHDMAPKGPSVQQVVQEVAPTKGQKRGKKKKAAAAATANPAEMMVQNSMQQQQGFQSYAGLKTGAVASSGAATVGTDSSAISLKSASMVPGSAFNFGPTPTGLGLPYGSENPPGYLEDFRNNPNPYYLPPGHRNNPDAAAVAEKSGGNVPVSAPSYHQFLSHPTTRPSYPFMNSPQLDTTSPLYQQYLQRATESEFRAQMMLNQGLLGPPGAPGAYSQSSYHHALGMHKSPYDAMNTMNRAPWF